MSTSFDPAVEPATHLIEIGERCYKRIGIRNDDGTMDEKCYSGQPALKIDPSSGKRSVVYEGDRVWVPLRIAEEVTNVKGVERPVGKLLVARSTEDAQADPRGDNWGAKDQKPRHTETESDREVPVRQKAPASPVRQRRQPDGQGAPAN